MMLDRFLSDVLLQDCLLQIGTENTIIAALEAGERNTEVVELLAANEKSNLYFLGGVKKEKGIARASDEDVLRKNYVYFDLDLRKAHADMADQEIKELASWFMEVLKDDPLFDGWRYMVFTGNGIHIYYFFIPILVQNKESWKEGMSEMTELFEKACSEKVDTSCVNVARIGRMPGSQNNKGEPKPVEILQFQDKWASWGTTLEERGKNRMEHAKKDMGVQAERFKIQYPLEADTYKTIQALPVSEVACRLFGWEYNGKHFFDIQSKNKSACFVPQGENFLVHGGTHHFAATQKGFSPFELVKAVKKLDIGGTFRWFASAYPLVAEASQKEKKDKQALNLEKKVGKGDVSMIFEELMNTNFECLKFDPYLDVHKIIIRGAITRIGAYSNIGKSKLAYHICNCLLKNGYHGMIFSTEVTRALVLANLLSNHAEIHFWDIIGRTVSVDPKFLDLYKNLEIYDVNQTQNSLQNYEILMTRAKMNGPLDFAIIDYCQSVTPVANAQNEYMQMTKYALEVQSLAQRLSIAIIDLSQISNEGVRDEHAKVGMIPFKGSGALYAAADIGVLLKREDKTDTTNNITNFEIRKHKYGPPSSIQLESDFKLGKFRVFGSQFEEVAPVIAGAMQKTLQI